MKRFVCILFILLMILAIGCSNRKDNEAVPEPTTTPYVVAYSTPEPEIDLNLSFECEKSFIKDTLMITVYSDDIAYYGSKIREIMHAIPEGQEVTIAFYLNENDDDYTMAFGNGSSFAWGLLIDKRSGEKQSHILKSEEDLYEYFPQLFLEDVESETVSKDDVKGTTADATKEIISYIRKNNLSSTLLKSPESTVAFFDKSFESVKPVYIQTMVANDNGNKFICVLMGITFEEKSLGEIADMEDAAIDTYRLIHETCTGVYGEMVIAQLYYINGEDKILFATVNDETVYLGWM